MVISPWRLRKIYKKKNLTKKNVYYFYDSYLLNKFIFIYFRQYPKIFFLLIKILILKNNYLSIGIFFILLCVINKIKPTIFGFDLKEDMSKRSHYYVKNWPIGGRHDFKSEHLIIQLLKEKNLVDIVI